ncbi:MAG: ArsR family transcriptional regulator [Candidatus Abyssobacteria bacterium SURF_5]|uniref:ArsR family transcriptional regulator n=1 Tax=Abyssobacteria bacterium (strain SURF_5) TaxID=2093360 RepID=A0A3A4NEU6_ABYX5|nr:MAG: ArsR family transcriptional regulator [Candidatus Abyssubacteria bacterium SURF_5]
MATDTARKHDETVCEVAFVNKERVQAVRARIPQADILEKLSEIFKVLGDPSRLRIVSALNVRELCVCDIASLLGASISAVSHQLRILRNLKLVKHRKEGKMVYYSLDDACIEKLIREGLKHIQE